jgi:16S rRNA (adenine1518-N6/adenine1519-N6)-dimethyltransferase
MARRIAAPHGNKEYGILSVLTQAFYDVSYLFDVPPTAFVPPPKVTSGVIHALKKKNEETEHIPRKELKRVVKLAFNQRRKTLKNALKALQLDEQLLQMDIAGLRAEQLSVPAFIELAQRLKDKELGSCSLGCK